MTLQTRFKKLAKGFETAFFDIHNAGKRWTESTGIKFKANPSTIAERNERKEKITTIQILASRRQTELLNGMHGLIAESRHMENFIYYMDDFIANHPIKDIKKFHAVRSKFVEFVGKQNICCYEITEAYLRKYVQFLEQRLNGESAANYFAKLKQILKMATAEKLFRTNPADNIRVRKNAFLHKDVVDADEISILFKTEIGNQNVKNAFLFCLFTGLRYCDVSVLTWSNVTAKSIRIVQSKTNVPLDIPLSNDAIMLLPERGNPIDSVFKLPSHTGCQKWLKIWVKKAGIDKKISWHSSRHSFGTNLIKYGVDVSIASKLLGHTSLVNTQRYVRVNEEMKTSAISKLPSLNQ